MESMPLGGFRRRTSSDPGSIVGTGAYPLCGQKRRWLYFHPGEWLWFVAGPSNGSHNRAIAFAFFPPIGWKYAGERKCQYNIVQEGPVHCVISVELQFPVLYRTELVYTKR